MKKIYYGGVILTTTLSGDPIKEYEFFKGSRKEVKEKKDDTLVNWGIEHLGLNEKEIERLKEDPETFWEEYEDKNEYNILVLDDINFS